MTGANGERGDFSHATTDPGQPSLPGLAGPSGAPGAKGTPRDDKDKVKFQQVTEV
ncbi:hypothetical protein [Arthrobacter sp. Helios]|uniref:hypothetical protein n=1 Tax=Arthrobacter sp. Helios TaxID=2828862 RepID=UPI00206678B1|nr:hypothetical protein [Arthrobacter sp. Helios]UPO76351.1 hypothetical protein ArtHe_13480 [Arthrobacter sp. Helios]